MAQARVPAAALKRGLGLFNRTRLPVSSSASHRFSPTPAPFSHSGFPRILAAVAAVPLPLHWQRRHMNSMALPSGHGAAYMPHTDLASPARPASHRSFGSERDEAVATPAPLTWEERGNRFAVEGYLQALCESGQLQHAEEVMRDMEQRMEVSPASYTRLLSAKISAGDFDGAFQMFLRHTEGGRRPTAPMLTTMMNAAIDLGRTAELARLLQVQRETLHAYYVRLGQQSASQMTSVLAKSSEKHRLDPAVAIKGRAVKGVNVAEGVEGLRDHQVLKQIRLETRVLDQAVAEYKRMRECVTCLGRGANFRPAQLVLLEWFEPLQGRLRQELAAVERQLAEEERQLAEDARAAVLGEGAKRRRRPKKKAAVEDCDAHLDPAARRLLHSARAMYGPLISLLPPEKLAVITIHEVLGMALVQPNGVRFVTLALHVGKAVQSEVRLKRLQEDRMIRSKHPSVQDIRQAYRSLRTRIATAADPTNEQQPEEEGGKAEAEEEQALRALSMDDGEWTSEQLVAVGSCLIGMLVEQATVEVPLELAADDPDSALWFRRSRPSSLAHTLAQSPNKRLDAAAKRQLLLELREEEEREREQYGTTSPRVFAVGELLDGAGELASGDEVWDGSAGRGGEAPADEDEVAVVTQAAFLHHHQSDARGKSAGMIKCNPAVLHLIEQGHMVRELALAALLPMVVRPLPWASPTQGCYLKASVPVMRWRGSGMQRELVRNANMERVYEGLDRLGAVPWRINRDVYDVIQEGWKRGGGFAELPTRANAPYPQPPADFLSNAAARREWRRSKTKLKKKNDELHSLRCSLLLKLQVAEEFKEEEAIYFPHNLDFRGRCYPIPPHLNHMGSDLSRGLLHFAESEPLGEHGVYHLKLHIANLCGYNKVSFAERLAYVDQHMEEVRDSVREPLDGRRWWAEQEDPWQVLAACFDLVRALDHPDPASYRSRLPLHRDGSCNGLQHYAALGGDVDGAMSVNLLPSDKPQDVYSHVLQLVARCVEEDAASGNELAKKLHGNIIRKTIKQTVMTSVYGVTFVGARAQIESQLKDVPYLEEDEVNAASMYLARLTFDSMKRMFTGAREIMAWLGECARITGHSGAPISWETPLGLSVMQPYRRPGKKLVKTLMQTVVLEEQADNLPVHVQRQRTAFPPNYVHSLDSTHMFMTAERCDRHRITFAAVHDSYWTHACHVDEMSRQLRHAFVELHEQPLLDILLQQLQARYPDAVYPKVPERGPLNIRDVLDSPYFFH